MKAKIITERVTWMGAVDWNRRLFDSLIPLPEGTSYNAYLLRGSEKTALIDTVDPEKVDLLLAQLADVEQVDYIVSQHSEQDHAGAIPVIMEKYPQAQVLCSEKGRDMLLYHLEMDPERIRVVADDEVLSLGDRSLRFIYTPWVHWPETMCSFCEEEGILFSCDFFGSHLATSTLYADENPQVIIAAKRYYAEIMMPFRSFIKKHLVKLEPVPFTMIAPSHGPIYNKPEFILDAYKDWVSDHVANKVVIPYISMHGSTEAMVTHLVSSLDARSIEVHPFDLTVTDIGELAMALVDAATIVIGTPTVLFGPHPFVFSATHLANALRPKLRFAAIIGSYGWGTKAAEQLTELIPNLKVEVLGTLMCKGLPREEDIANLDALAQNIYEHHQNLD
ncbi:MAG: FprA family A-type flavoprotein [Candidatus Hydrogenedens sp.]|jgi:flavorubredoxin|nr:FprA family A-type flavoprotein [Candidatus Hydrogenedens sp.]